MMGSGIIIKAGTGDSLQSQLLPTTVYMTREQTINQSIQIISLGEKSLIGGIK